jgi:ABC-2 type transport system permease protein
MRGIAQLAWTEFKLNLRDLLMVFWSIAFPCLWLLIMTVIIGVPIPGFDYQGLNYASIVFPAGISLVILSASFIGIPQTLTSYRENGILRRLRATPVKTSTLSLGFSISQVAVVVLGVLVLFALSRIFLRVRILGSKAAFIGVLALGMLTFLAIGCAICSIAGSFRKANIIIWTAFSPMLMLSELFLPITILPSWLQPVARALPLTPVNTLLRDIVFGAPLKDLWRFGVLAAWTALAAIATIRFFRWERRPGFTTIAFSSACAIMVREVNFLS